MNNISDHVNQMDATALVEAGRKAIESGGTADMFKAKLFKHLGTLGEKYLVENGNEPDEATVNAVLNAWIDELLKFLALKTLLSDNTEPCQLAPGYIIGIAWKELVVMPSGYARVCYAMGNDSVFDHDPIDDKLSKVQVKHRFTRYNATLRFYNNHFEQEPPPLFWTFKPRQKKLISEYLFEQMDQLCGCGNISMSSYEKEVSTNAVQIS